MQSVALLSNWKDTPSVNSSIEESTRLQTVLLDAQRGLIRLKNFMDV